MTEEFFPDPNLAEAIDELFLLSGDSGPAFQSELEDITYLDGRGWSITNLSGIGYCTNLTNLDLGGNQITDISPISNLTNLTVLYLDRNQLTDITPLAALTKLTNIELSGNRITDISPLVENRALAKGVVINLRGNPLGNQSVTDHIPQLRQRGVQVLLGDPLITFPDRNLEEAVRYPAMSQADRRLEGDIYLSYLEGLTGINASAADISDLTNLEYCTNLIYLSLAANHISDITVLSCLTKLQQLDLRDNEISDISPLSVLTELTELELEGNQVSDISPLVNNSGLGRGDVVYLAHNPLSRTSIDDYIPYLKERGVIISY